MRAHSEREATHWTADKPFEPIDCRLEVPIAKFIYVGRRDPLQGRCPKLLDLIFGKERLVEAPQCNRPRTRYQIDPSGSLSIEKDYVIDRRLVRRHDSRKLGGWNLDRWLPFASQRYGAAPKLRKKIGGRRPKSNLARVSGDTGLAGGTQQVRCSIRCICPACPGAGISQSGLAGAGVPAEQNAAAMAADARGAYCRRVGVRNQNECYRLDIVISEIAPVKQRAMSQPHVGITRTQIADSLVLRISDDREQLAMRSHDW